MVHGVLLMGVMVLTASSGSTPSAGPLRPADRVEAVGESLARLKRAYDRLCSPPLNDPEFVLSDVGFQRTRRFTEYSGDISGRMLGALNSAGEILGCQSPMIDALIAGFRRYQKPDGHFGRDQDLHRGVNQARDMPILWGNGRLLLALAERHRCRPSEEVLTLARRLGEYAVSTRPHYGRKENFERVGGVAASGYTTCYPSLIDGLAALGDVCGDPRFLEEARFIAGLSLSDREFAKHHSHGRLTAYRGMLDLDRFTGKRDFIDAVASGYRRVLDDFILPTGGVTEYFDRTYDRDEGCSEGDWLRVSYLLWVATGRMEYLDAAEHVLRNHILPTQFSNGGFGHWVYLPLSDGKTDYPYGGISNVGSESYWCCAMHCTQALADAVRWGVVTDGRRILITWLAEVRATFKPRDAASPITVGVERSGADSWKVSADLGPAGAMPLALRVPGWAEAIVVDGKRRTPENGWVVVEPKESGSMALQVLLPGEIRLHGPYRSQVEEGQPVRVFAGPDLYCLPEVHVGEKAAPRGAVPTLLIAAQRPVDGQVPVLIEDGNGKRQRAALVPMSRRPAGGARYLFRVRRVDAETFGRLVDAAEAPPGTGRAVELEFGCDGECEVYLNGKLTHRHTGWDESPQVEVYSDRAENVLAVKARSGADRPGLIGVIRVGGRTVVTQPGDWTVVPATETVPADWLVNPEKGMDPAARLVDLGGFGAPPWNHTPADYAGTPARWIWAETPEKSPRQWWLFRCRFANPP